MTEISASLGVEGLGRRQAFRMFIILAAISALAVSLQVGKGIVVGHFGMYFLARNLFLAWIPLGLSTLIRELHARPGGCRLFVIGPLAMAWLLFFPNAPYLVTDLEHIGKATDAPPWYDALTLFCYGLAGLMVGFTSLLQMQRLMDVQAGKRMSWCFVCGVLGLSGFGIYLGKVLRWNSWDLVMRPGDLLRDIWEPMRQPLDHPHAVLFTGLFSVVLLLGYLAVTTISAFPPGRLERDQ